MQPEIADIGKDGEPLSREESPLNVTKIKQMIECQGLTYSDLYNGTGISPRTVRDILARRDIKEISLTDALRLADTLGCHLDDIINPVINLQKTS